METNDRINVTALKKKGTFQQKNRNYYVLRLRLVAGDLTATQLRKVAEVADRYAHGGVHLSTRQGIEIHYVHISNIEAARQELESVGLRMGALGPCVRTVMACPGDATCPRGVIETKSIAHALDSKYVDFKVPHKFKIAVTGCRSNCAKATDNDFGIMGAVQPVWEPEECTDCTVCEKICPAKAIERSDMAGSSGRSFQYFLDKNKCITCGNCIVSCPAKSWQPVVKGFAVYIGGTRGKRPRVATLLRPFVSNAKELYSLADAALTYYQNNGRPKERFGHMIDRIGEALVVKKILDTVYPESYRERQR